MEKNSGAENSMKPGEKAKDPERGWFIVNENGAQIFLEDDREEYIKTYKRYNDVNALTSFSDIAQKLIFNTTDEKNG
ncbi:MAG TPA: hypothetical protein P5509_01480 [Bacteroidales bacterium]|nr:hypothetical protein [Bacteroidales bacterium]